jgi:CRISPR system Cascade subunit CasB
MTHPNSWITPFVKRLMPLASDDNPNRAALAHLRRGLGEPADRTLSRVGWLFPSHLNDVELDAAILAAGLFAWTKGECKHTTNINFGRAFGGGLSEDEKKAREKRFVALLDADGSELPVLLRQAFSLIEGTPLDWEQLIIHLIDWDRDDRRVQRYWARGFWWTATDDRDESDAEQPEEATAN